MNLAFVGMAAALGLSASGSAYGAGTAGMATIGAWKKCYAAGKPAPFIMIAFTGAPLTQIIYGFLLMNFIRNANCDPGMALGVGIFGGLAIGLSALNQGKCSAGASRRNRKGYCKLLHCHRYRGDSRTVHPGLLPAASEQLMR